eukprot:EG_transcript_18883
MGLQTLLSVPLALLRPRSPALRGDPAVAEFCFPDMPNESAADADLELPGGSGIAPAGPAEFGLQCRRRNRVVPLLAEPLAAGTAPQSPDSPCLPRCSLSLPVVRSGPPSSHSSIPPTPSSYSSQGSQVDSSGRTFSFGHRPSNQASVATTTSSASGSSATTPAHPPHPRLPALHCDTPTAPSASGSPRLRASLLASARRRASLRPGADDPEDDEETALPPAWSPVASEVSTCGPRTHRRKQQYIFVVRR